MGTLDQISEQSETVATIQREHPTIMNQILERLPKLPLRKPPAQDSSASSQSAPQTTPDPQAQQSQPAGQHQTYHMPTQHPAFELRINDHMPVPPDPFTWSVRRNRQPRSRFLERSRRLRSSEHSFRETETCTSSRFSKEPTGHVFPNH